MVYGWQVDINCKSLTFHKVYGKESFCERVLRPAAFRSCGVFPAGITVW